MDSEIFSDLWDLNGLSWGHRVWMGSILFLQYCVIPYPCLDSSIRNPAESNKT